LAACEVLSPVIGTIDPECLQKGLAETRWPGRLEQVLDRPLTLLDGAHNHDGVSGIVGALEKMLVQRSCRLHVVWGAVGDKSLDAIMALLPSHASYHWCAADIPRALPASDVAKLRPSLKGEVHATPLAALRAALEEAAHSDIVWVGGSLFVIGDVLRDAPQAIEGWTG
jgi:dihydrofolate synthase/folylpolyglutamate synthase